MTTLAADHTADDTWARLGAAAQLLHHAALRVWDQADSQSIDSPLHSLGLGVYLAEAQISALLPAEHDLVDIEDPARHRDVRPDVDLEDALQLLINAEELTRPLPVERPDLAGTSQIALDLCDLIREARNLGY